MGYLENFGENYKKFCKKRNLKKELTCQYNLISKKTLKNFSENTIKNN